MIKDFIFIVKSLGITILVVLLLQFKVGEKTLDQNFHSWLAESVFVDYIQTSIDGGVAATRTGYKKLHTSVNSALSKFGKHHKKDDQRSIGLNIKRYNADDSESENGEEFLPQSQAHKVRPH